MSYKNYLSLFDDLSVNQKSSLISHIKVFTKKYSSFSVNEIWQKFSEEQEYLFEINNPVFPWIKEYLSRRDFEKAIIAIINQQKLKITCKEKNKEYIESQKEKIKNFKAKAKQWRQSKEKPTKKQISYYNSLCSKIGVPKENLANKSKLDLLEMITELVSKKGANSGL